jgi:hypothetical protein
MLEMKDGKAYFVRAVSYVCKIFMKLSTGFHVINTSFSSLLTVEYD